MKKIYSLIAVLVLVASANAQPPTNGLVAKYTFDGGVMTDASGNNHTLTNVGTTLSSEPGGSPGMALNFNGANYLYADNMGTYLTDYTISMWVKPNRAAMLAQSGIYPTLLNIGGDINIGYSEQADIYNMVSMWSPSTNGGLGLQSDVRIDDGHWLMVTVTWESATNTLKMYANNTLVWTSNFTFTHGQRTPTHKLSIGAGLQPDGAVDPATYFNGDIDQVYIYNRILLNYEVSALYYAVTPTPSIPYFIVTPVNANVHACQGETYTSYAYANGHNNVSVEWLRNGFQFGQPSGNLYLSPLSFADNASYYAQAINSAGLNFSEQFSLTVDSSIALVNDLPDTTYICANGDSALVTLTVNTTGALNNVTYGWILGVGEGQNLGTGLGLNSITVSVANGTTISAYAVGSCGYVNFTPTYIMFTNPAAPVVGYDNTTLTATGGTYSTIQWYKNGQPIDGATNANYVPTENGDYYAVVSVGNCTSQTNTFTVTNLVGLAETAASQGVSLYPNPAVNGSVFIKLNTVKPGDMVTVFSTDGKQLKQITISNSITQLDITDLSAGYYFIKVTGAGKNCTLPVVKM